MKPQALVTNISTLNYQELYQQCMNLHKENKILKNNVTPACRRKVRKQKNINKPPQCLNSNSLPYAKQ